MTTITSLPNRRPLVALVIGMTAVVGLAGGVWALRGDNRPVATVQAAPDNPLPPAVAAAFTDMLHNRADGRGAVTVTYVESQLGTASSTLNMGEVASNPTTPVWVVFARGRFTFKIGASRGGSPVPGNVIALIDADGRIYTGGGYGQSIADLARLGSPKTTVVDAG